jgi:endonuclease/exonuclease/phosphatase family metal-dependent hydrolase
MMKVLTWNVLHRVHAENYGEQTIRTHVDEPSRVQRVVELLANADVEVALLQEVSGDVLAALRARFAGLAVLNHLYPRMPKFKRGGTSVNDASEHLVVLAPAGSKVLRAVTYESDPGKGLLAVMTPSGVCVVTTHVSWGPKREAQLEVLGGLLRDVKGPVVVGGDFNTEREVLVEALGTEVEISELPSGSLRTRAVEDGEGQDIDHLIARGVTLEAVEVRPHGALSDHRPVTATLISLAPLGERVGERGQT